MDAPSLHIAMFSYFAMGHLTPYLHLSNKLAKKGHIISFLIPKRTQAKLQHFNHYPHLINFVPITVPHVDGLPHGAETTNDVPAHLLPLILTAMDHTKHDIETLLLELKPNFVFFDFAHWIPTLTRRLGIKCMHYMIISPVAVAYDISPARQVQGDNLTEHELMQPPQGFPDPSIKLNIHEARANVAIRTKESGGGVSIVERLATASSLSDAIGFKGCRGIDGPFVDYLAQFGKCVLLSGPVIPNPPASSLEEKWALWLKGFKAGSVIYCTLGSEFILQLNQFQELPWVLSYRVCHFLQHSNPQLDLTQWKQLCQKVLKKEFKEGEMYMVDGFSSN